MESSCRKPRLEWLRGRLAPSFPELLFAALVLGGFARVLSWQALLYDGDTGWHIRTGALILESGAVPRTDPFSFSHAGQTWFAWEWLADVFFAGFARWDGLRGAVAATVVVLCAAAALLFCWLLRRGVGLWIGLGVTLAAMSASSVHYLARPHIFSLLLFTVSLWMLDEDRKRPGPILWLLVPMAALWANLHGGFVALLASVALLAATEAWERHWAGLRRYGALWVWCAVATLVNPYGWHLHAHVAGYLGSSWIVENVLEFHSPSIRSEGMVVFAVLLLTGAGCAARALPRDRFAAVLALGWGLAAMRSARHVPLFAVAAAPVVASELAAVWGSRALRRAGSTLTRILWDAGQELAARPLWSLAGPCLGLLALAAVYPAPAAADFPAFRFPVAAVTRNLERLAPPGAPPRLLSSDVWGGYLIYRLYPRQRVFFDGRSDFYGSALGSEYVELLSAGTRWRETLARYDFELALLPLDWPLASVLDRDPGWELVYADDVARLFRRRVLAHRSLHPPTAELEYHI